MKRFFVTLTVIATVGLAGFASIIAYVDPFFHYHKPIEGFPYVVDDQVDMNPGLARNMDYDGVLLGNRSLSDDKTFALQHARRFG